MRRSSSISSVEPGLPLPAHRLALPRLIAGDEPFPPISDDIPGDTVALLTRELGPERMIEGYRLGYFPWPPRVAGWMPWWSPDPRAVLLPEAFHLGRNLRRLLRRSRWALTHDCAFAAVLEGCAAPRPGREQTWLSEELKAGYLRLHQTGFAHSVEVWDGDRLVGGLFGVSVGAAFCGDSMFSEESEASKIALLYLCRQLAREPLALIDCQLPSEHLERLGARLLPRREFLILFEKAKAKPDPLASPSLTPQPAPSLLSV